MGDYITYNEIRKEIKNGDILMYKGKGTVSSIIKFLTHSQYSHAGVAVWWNERMMVMEAVGKGVILSPLSRNIEHFKGDVEWFQYKGGISKEDRIKIIVRGQKELGKKYATWKVVWFGIKIYLKLHLKKDNATKSDRLFCSEYVSAMYGAINLDLDMDKANRNTSPDDIVKSVKTEMKGILKSEVSE